MTIAIIPATVLSVMCISLNLSASVCGGEDCLGMVEVLGEYEVGRFHSLEKVSTVYNDTWNPCSQEFTFNNESTIACDTEGGEASLTAQVCNGDETEPPPTMIPLTEDDDEAVVIIVVVFSLIAILIIITYLLCKASAKGPRPHLTDVTFQQVIQADREARPQLHKYYSGNDLPPGGEPLLDTVQKDDYQL